MVARLLDLHTDLLQGSYRSWVERRGDSPSAKEPNSGIPEKCSCDVSQRRAEAASPGVSGTDDNDVRGQSGVSTLSNPTPDLLSRCLMAFREAMAGRDQQALAIRS